jgi:hypothetical protein
MSKKDILAYCREVAESDMDHIQAAKDNLDMITKGEYRNLIGCPNSFGLDDHVGLCETETVEGYYAQCNQCEQCWREALGVDE